MIKWIRKAAVLMVLLSGSFLFVNLVTHTLHIEPGSAIYCIAQMVTLLTILMLLATKKVEIN